MRWRGARHRCRLSALSLDERVLGWFCGRYGSDCLALYNSANVYVAPSGVRIAPRQWRWENRERQISHRRAPWLKAMICAQKGAAAAAHLERARDCYPAEGRSDLWDELFADGVDFAITSKIRTKKSPRAALFVVLVGCLNQRIWFNPGAEFMLRVPAASPAVNGLAPTNPASAAFSDSASGLLTGPGAMAARSIHEGPTGASSLAIRCLLVTSRTPRTHFRRSLWAP
jgi:hypothetical protein